MQDVTAAQAAEASRRQFSANVSHELRTPLTTISGYAELLSSGMLQKPEDATEFGRKILAESRRLLTLIEDIIRLSRLDEGGARRSDPRRFDRADSALRPEADARRAECAGKHQRQRK